MKLRIAVAPPAPAPAGTGSTATLRAAGYVTARRQVPVSAQVTGTLTEVLIEEGEHVQAGQVLARLGTAQKPAVAQAKAQLEAAQAVLENMTCSPGPPRSWPI